MPSGGVIRIEIGNQREWSRAVSIIERRLNAAAYKATEEGLALIERQGKLILRRYTHAPGTRTTSPPGQPPALVTGNLSRSWRSTPVGVSGVGIYSGRTGPTAIYSRAQELGWPKGGLPARPFVQPVWDANRERVRQIYVTRATQAIMRGGW